MSSSAPSGVLRLWWGVAAAAFALLCLARGAVWEPAHDEGVTWHQIAGPAPIPAYPAPALLLESAYAQLDPGAWHGPGAVLDALRAEGGMHPPLYYLGANAWGQIAGSSQLAFAVPAIALGFVSIWAFGRVAAIGAPGSTQPAWALGLIALSPWLAGMTNFARPYALAVCLALLATLCALEMAGPRPRARWGVAFALFSALGLYTLYHYLFVLVWHVGLLALAGWRAPGRRRALVRLGAALGAITLAYAPWIPSLLGHLEVTGGQPWYFNVPIEPSQWARRTARLLGHFALGEKHVGFPALAAFSALCLVTLPFALRSFRSSSWAPLEPRAQALWLAAPLVPLALIASDLVRGSYTFFVTKPTFALFPVLLLLLARAIAGAPAGRVRNALGAAWCALGIAVSLNNTALHERVLMPMESAAQKLARDTGADDWIVVSTREPSFVYTLLLSLRDAGLQDGRIVYARQADVEALLRLAATHPEVDAVSLLSINVDWAPEQNWDEAWLRELAARARAGGWQVGVRNAVPRSEGGGRRLRIAGDLRAYYFSM